ncbi:hypothetical protein Cantr_08377 [Candida viswanathii]|uniref:Uncharacterized protein n=1 Tax=Candida viswanathii TaxID=5486 RepID=A0A367Y4A0_9ASCO|nr:hypothetical protein Cantr_08377 [Candida viswanathii]
MYSKARTSLTTECEALPDAIPDTCSTGTFDKPVATPQLGDIGSSGVDSSDRRSVVTVDQDETMDQVVDARSAVDTDTVAGDSTTTRPTIGQTLTGVAVAPPVEDGGDAGVSPRGNQPPDQAPVTRSELNDMM